MSDRQGPMDFENAVAQFFSEDARAAYAWQQRYNAYIASDQWRHKRLQKLLSLVGIAAQIYNSIDWLVLHASRYLYRCENCGATGKQDEIGVHHRHYHNLGNELLEDLVVLCPFCHEALHKVARATGLDVAVVIARLVGPQR